MAEYEAWIADCHFREIGVEGDYRCQAAVWADNYGTFRTRLSAHAADRGLKVLWIEECLSALQYLSRHGQQQPVGLLARAVHPHHTVELGPMVNVGAEGKLEGDDSSHLIIEEIKDVEPLDGQVEIWPKKNVPAALMEPLFDQPTPTDTEIAHYGGVEFVPPMKTYAILDAAKFQWGFSEIEDCELPFRCLFKGKAAKELENVAPYLIEINPEAIFTRRLFTHNPKMPDEMTSVHLWRKDPGIYVRSRASFDDFWKHLRKFTRIQDEAGKWYYFRFWEPRWLQYVLKSIPREQSIKLLAPAALVIVLSSSHPALTIKTLPNSI